MGSLGALHLEISTVLWVSQSSSQATEPHNRPIE